MPTGFEPAISRVKVLWLNHSPTAPYISGLIKRTLPGNHPDSLHQVHPRLLLLFSLVRIHIFITLFFWGERWESNPSPADSQSTMLPVQHNHHTISMGAFPLCYMLTRVATLYCLHSRIELDIPHVLVRLLTRIEGLNILPLR